MTMLCISIADLYATSLNDKHAMILLYFGCPLMPVFFGGPGYYIQLRLSNSISSRVIKLVDMVTLPYMQNATTELNARPAVTTHPYLLDSNF